MAAAPGNVPQDAQTTGSAESPDARRLRPWLAFLAGLFGFLAGYVYVGRPRTALVVLGALVAVLTLLCGSRVVVTRPGFYALVAALVAAAVVAVVHPTWIAWTQRRARREWYNRWWIYVLVWLVTECAVVYADRGNVLRAAVFGFDTYRIPSAAMLPTLEVGDVFVVDRWAYRHAAPRLGDIVVLVFPQSGDERYVKRIVGLPGDSIDIRDAVVYRNGLPLQECYVHEPAAGRAYGRDMPAVHLGPDEYFVLGDFRDNSRDSREFGPVPRGAILGTATFVWLRGTAGPPGGHDACRRGL